VITDQHIPFDAALVDVTDVLPRWLPALDIDPGWHIDTGEFPHRKDEALIEKEETDVR
jgi:hypothetical protein